MAALALIVLWLNNSSLPLAIINHAQDKQTHRLTFCVGSTGTAISSIAWKQVRQSVLLKRPFPWRHLQRLEPKGAYRKPAWKQRKAELF
jgi:hypothetical protein